MSDDRSWWKPRESKERALRGAMAMLEEPPEDVTVRTLMGSRVFDDAAARQDYPYCSSTHPNIYPGKLVPMWAVELRARLLQYSTDQAWVKNVLAYFGRWRASERAKAQATLVVAAVAQLENASEGLRQHAVMESLYAQDIIDEATVMCWREGTTPGKRGRR